ncbi:MAG: RNA polymerase sigma-70 factor [Proteiniphilum sp.]
MNNLIEQEDKIFIELLQKDNVLAFDHLFRKYSPKLFRFALSLLKSSDDAQDIVQETFYRIWIKRHDINLDKPFNSFVFTISYNLMIDQLRLRIKDKACFCHLHEQINDSQEPSLSNIDYNTLCKQIKQAIDELPVKRKTIFILSRESELSHREIADKMGISMKTVENQINLSLRHIRMRLKNYSNYLDDFFFFFL